MIRQEQLELVAAWSWDGRLVQRGGCWFSVVRTRDRWNEAEELRERRSFWDRTGVVELRLSAWENSMRDGWERRNGIEDCDIWCMRGDVH